MTINKNFLFLLVGRLVQIVLAVSAIRLMTELLHQSEVGKQYLINSMILWFSMVLINPVGMYVNRHVHEWVQKKEIYRFIYQLNLYFVGIAILSIPLLFLAQAVLNVGGDLSILWLVVYVTLYIFLSTWFQTLVSFFNLFEMQKHFVALNIFSQVVGLTCAVLLVRFQTATAFAWLFGLLIGQTLTLLVAGFYFKKHFKADVATSEGSKWEFFSIQTVKFCYPIAIATIFMWFMNQGYRIYVQKILGTDVLASIGVGLGLATSLAGVVESLATQFFYPKYYGSLADTKIEQRKEAWLELWKNTSFVYIPFCFLTIAVAPLVVRVLTAAQFHNVVKFVCLGAFIELFRQLSNIAYIASHAEKKTTNIIAPYAFGAGFLFLCFTVASQLNYLLDATTILYILISAGFLTLVCNVLIVKKLLKIHIDLMAILKAVMISVPLLGFVFLMQVEQALWSLILCGAAAGSYCVGVVLYRLKMAS